MKEYDSLNLLENIEKDIEDAFVKLKNNIYFDTTDILLRKKLADYINTNSNVEIIQSVKRAVYEDDYFDKLVLEIDLNYYPKKVNINFKKCDWLSEAPSNFITNQFDFGGILSKMLIFCDMPIELHILSILWIKKYGTILDKKINKHIYSNRLISENKRSSGHALFKPYSRQYQKWWSNAVDESKNLLEKNENVCIINFDIKDYYHGIQIDLIELRNEFLTSFPEVSKDPIYLKFEKIHIAYRDKFATIKHPSFNSANDKCPIPVGLMSSYILANWYLNDFDNRITKELTPVYYGRYVDDFLIVVKNTIFENLSEEEKNRYSESINRKIKKNDTSINLNILHYYMEKWFENFLEPFIESDSDNNQINYKIKHKKYQNLNLQYEKLFVYQFNSKLSPNLISKFVDEQKKHSSEFRFLSDEEDDSFQSFEINILENTFDKIEENKSKFKVIEDNKRNLSVYLAKLIRRRIERGKDYKRDETEKIKKYFQGIICIRHFYFWEKLFTLFLVSDEKKIMLDLFEEIKHEIEKIEPDLLINIDKEKIKSDLKNVLLASIEIYGGLFPRSAEIIFKNDDKNNFDFTRFRRSGLLRRQFIYFPLIQFTEEGKSQNFSFFDRTIFDNDLLKNLNICDSPPSYPVKFWETYLLCFRRHILKFRSETSTNLIRKIDDFFSNKDLLEETFKEFCKLNNLSTRQEEIVKSFYYRIFESKSNTENWRFYEIYIPKGLKPNTNFSGHFRTAIINQYVKPEDYEKSLQGSPHLSSDRIENFAWMKDQIQKINNLDLVVLPELALPHPLISDFCRFSANQQIGITSGIEYIKIGNIGFNFILTCLPINIDGTRDAIPTLRLKNHYAPEEEDWIRGNKIIVPKPKPYNLELFEWRNVYFSILYCYELADIWHRVPYLGKVDLLVSPVWNADINYYNSIIDSTTRDLHCFIIQANTSQFGDSRITQPTNHIRKDKARIKGGTTNDYRLTIIVSDLEISDLRKFQKLNYTAQKLANKDNNSYKPTPPDFPDESIQIRIKNERFFEK